MATTKVQFNPGFRAANQTRRRYRALRGSAGSGKSVNIAQDYIVKLSDPKYRGANLLVVCKAEESNRDSTYAELIAAINRIFGSRTDEFWETRSTPLSMTCKTTGNSIIFRGMNDAKQREKVKSINYVV